MADFHHQSVEETLSALNTQLGGLSGNEAARRLERDGGNRLLSTPPMPAWKILVGQFTNFIIYLLLIAVVFSLAIGEYGDSLVILAILIMNGLIGFFQELRANRSLESLRNMVRILARVTREGTTSTVDAVELVKGDIIILENGDRIPADARLINAIELQLEESSLTGESEPVRKQLLPLAKEACLADRTNMVFSGTSVVGGRGVAVVTACGMDTEIGRIAQMVAGAREERTPLQRRLDRFGRNLGLVIVIICLLVFSLCLGRHYLDTSGISIRAFLDFAFIAISLAVAAVPTALPAVVTIALSIGTRRLLAKNMLVRRLTSVETLGSCDVICSDKTGTLTMNRMEVKKAWTLAGAIDFNHDDAAARTLASPSLASLFAIGGVCNNSQDQFAAGKGGSPTELALLAAARQAGIGYGAQRVNEHPFDSARKRMSVMVKEDEGYRLDVKGAPEQLLDICRRVQIGGEAMPMDENARQLIVEMNHHFANQAMRVMAFATRQAENAEDMKEENLIFVGLMAMIDPPRHEVPDSIRQAAAAHIRVIMITGDHRETAAAIAREIGITGNILTGSQLDAMSDVQLNTALATTNIFARVVPEHKLRIVRALQEQGHTVAMTGDGVNDAPALKKADIGIAVGSGTDVAREASDFVLLDDSFTSIVAGVEEGRGIYENIQKSIMLLLSGNLMEVLIIFLAALMGFNLPLTALLLLWINLITDGAPALAYSVDPYGTGIMRRPPIPLREGILPAARLRLLIGLGIAGTLIGLTLFHLSGGNSSDPATLQRAQTIVFNYIVLYEMMLVFVIRRSYQVKMMSNGWLWLAVLFSIAMQGVIMYSPLHTVFRVTPLMPADLGYLLTATFVFSGICLAFSGAPGDTGSSPDPRVSSEGAGERNR